MFCLLRICRCPFLPRPLSPSVIYTPQSSNPTWGHNLRWKQGILNQISDHGRSFAMIWDRSITAVRAWYLVTRYCVMSADLGWGQHLELITGALLRSYEVALLVRTEALLWHSLLGTWPRNDEWEKKWSTRTTKLSTRLLVLKSFPISNHFCCIEKPQSAIQRLLTRSAAARSHWHTVCGV